MFGALPEDAEELLIADFWWREEVMTTGVGFGWALPHIVSDSVTERVVALGKSKKGVDFASLDGKPAYSILLMILPAATESNHDA